MIYGITGHTYGFGKYISDRLIADGHSVIGISRSTGFDLTDTSNSMNAVQHLSECDVIINNSSAGHLQSFFLLQLYSEYRMSNKIIINVGSWITRVSDHLIHAEDMDHYEDKVTLQVISNDINKKNKAIKSVYLTWGFHLGNPILDRYPQLQDTTTVHQAVDQLISRQQ